MSDIFGQALLDHSQGKEYPLKLNNSYGKPEEMPVWYLFREYSDMPELEKMALSVCEGHVLDIGAGTGAHSLILQQLGYEVTAIDTSEQAVEIMRESGVAKVKCTDFFDFNNKKFDTLLLLMNGVGIIGKMDRFESFLDHARQLLNPDGQLIFDSSDIGYLYESDSKPVDSYFGEVRFQYEYRGEKGEWFDWLYIDPDTLAQRADLAGWYTYFLHKDENDQYLVRMIPK